MSRCIIFLALLHPSIEMRGGKKSRRKQHRTRGLTPSSRRVLLSESIHLTHKSFESVSFRDKSHIYLADAQDVWIERGRERREKTTTTCLTRPLAKRMLTSVIDQYRLDSKSPSNKRTKPLVRAISSSSSSSLSFREGADVQLYVLSETSSRFYFSFVVLFLGLSLSRSVDD